MKSLLNSWNKLSRTTRWTLSIAIAGLIVIRLLWYFYSEKGHQIVQPVTLSTNEASPQFKIGDTFGNFRVISVESSHGGYIVSFEGTTTVSGTFGYNGDVGNFFNVKASDRSQIPYNPNDVSDQDTSFCLTDLPSNIPIEGHHTIVIADFVLVDTPTSGCSEAKFVNMIE